MSPRIEISFAKSSTNQNIYFNNNYHKIIYQQNKLHVQPIPRWLLELTQNLSTTTDPNIVSSDQHQQQALSRPFSENVINHNRPKWFEELLQNKRRMSDISNRSMEDDNASTGTNNNNNRMLFSSNSSNSINSNKVKYSDSDLPTMTNLLSAKSNDISKAVDDDDDDAFMASPFTNQSTKSSGKKKSTSSNNRTSSTEQYDDQLFSFTNNTFKSIENLRLDEMNKCFDDDDCVIPEMPTGLELMLVLLENWGDQHFIGLNGIEILDQCGNRPRVKNIFLETDYLGKRCEMNDLLKLLDNVYRTHDDAHIWQYRFEDKPAPVRIIFEFDKPTTIALIRIWNHNKSRIHSYRGVKYAKVKLDEQTIFCGEIAKASGDLTGSLENFGDTILFTTNEDILEQISHFDVSFQELLMEQITN